jgi:hypothetical protein
MLVYREFFMDDFDLTFAYLTKLSFKQTMNLSDQFLISELLLDCFLAAGTMTHVVG